MFTIGCGVTAAQGPPAPQDLNIYFKITFFLDLILSAVCYQLSEIFLSTLLDDFSLISR